MKVEQYTYWSVTINNPDENDYVLIRNPNDKYIRSLVWTPEEGGEEHTPHIQAWVRMQRNVTQAFMKKIYPRAHFRYITKDEYNENCHAYAQKNDETTKGLHHISLNDPLPANDTLLYQVLERSFEELLQLDKKFKESYDLDYDSEHKHMIVQDLTLKKLETEIVERAMVRERSGLEKIFVSAVYEKMKSRFWRDILYRIIHNKNGDNDGLQTEDGSRSSRGSSEIRESDEESQADCSEGRYESRSTTSGAGSDF